MKSSNLICCLVGFILVQSVVNFRLLAQSSYLDQIDSVYQLVVKKADTINLPDLNNIIARNLTKDFDITLYYADQLYLFSNELNFDRGMSLARNLQGEIYERKGLLDEAEKAYLEALGYAKRSHNTQVTMSSYNNLSIIYSIMGYMELSIQNLLEALKIAELGNDKRMMAILTNNLGLRYYELQQPEKALPNFNRAKQINTEQKDFRRLGLNLDNIGLAYLKLEAHDSAYHYFKLALKTKQQYGDQFDEELVYTHLAGYFESLGKLDSAKKYTRLGLDIAEKLDDVYGIASINLIEAEIDQKSGDLALGLKKVNQAEVISKKNQFRQVLIDVYRKKSDLYSEIGNYEDAFKYQKLYQDMRDSMLLKDKDKALNRITGFNEEKAAKEMQIMEKDAEIQQIAIQKQRTQKRLAYIIGALLLLLFLGLMHRYRYTRKTKNTIERERDRSDELLLNILPAATAAELKEKGKTQARLYDMVSILFTDFEGFTMLSSKMSAQELVEEIDYCYRNFDEMIGKYGIEKIKTIGDSYMCAGGLPIPNKTHATDLVHAAIDIRNFMNTHNQERQTQNLDPLRIRLGIHSGPVVAGIVGIKKFAYDVWGDTVNIASRMESNGEVGKINISETTYKLVQDEFHCESRGEVGVKHVGLVKMYYVNSS